MIFSDNSPPLDQGVPPAPRTKRRMVIRKTWIAFAQIIGIGLVTLDHLKWLPLQNFYLLFVAYFAYCCWPFYMILMGRKKGISVTQMLINILLLFLIAFNEICFWGGHLSGHVQICLMTVFLLFAFDIPYLIWLWIRTTGDEDEQVTFTL